MARAGELSPPWGLAGGPRWPAAVARTWRAAAATAVAGHGHGIALAVLPALAVHFAVLTLSAAAVRPQAGRGAAHTAPTVRVVQLSAAAPQPVAKAAAATADPRRARPAPGADAATRTGAREPDGPPPATSDLAVVPATAAIADEAPATAAGAPAKDAGTDEAPVTAAAADDAKASAVDNAPTAADASAKVPPTRADGLGTAAADGPGIALDYLPRSLLTVAPRPLASIDIPFPPSVDGELNLGTELSLFIDEHGVVRHVRIDGAPLPAALAEAARVSFLDARFTPGELNGESVRSWIRVEVRFDTERMPAAPASR